MIELFNIYSLKQVLVFPLIQECIVTKEKCEKKDLLRVVRNNEGVVTHIYCKPYEKVSEIIKRYRNKASDFEDNKKFIFNAKELNQSLTADEAGILNNANIFVVLVKK